MRYNVLTYLIGEGISNIFKNKKQAATSFGTMCVIMIFFGICFMLVGNFNNFIKQVESEQGIQAYITNDATDDEIKTLGEEIKALDGVNTIEFVSKEEALQHMKDRLGEKSYLLDGYDQNNVFPSSYVITLTDLKKSSDVQAKIKEMENVKKITSSDETIETLVRIAKGVKIGSYVIIIALVAISVFIISNTIKLAVYSNKREIFIMRYIGATNKFIKKPFVIEGAIMGIVSALISFMLISIAYVVIYARIPKVGSSLGVFGFIPYTSLWWMILAIYIVLGLFIGILGSSISIKKYLKA